MRAVYRVKTKWPLLPLAVILLTAIPSLIAQTPRPAMAELGSRTAKGGFRNETDIAAKFNNWKADEDSRMWLVAMNYKLTDILSITAGKPHGEKADVEVRVTTRSGETVEGISIKLVSSTNGFNQIDKRWLATYARMWKMPAAVVDALKLFVGEKPPVKPGRDAKRMYLTEFELDARQTIVDFFTANKDAIVSDIIAGDGPHAAKWFMVAHRTGDKTRWILKPSVEAAKFFSEGKVEITRAGNLKIGRITMQRKGGDGGRETAKMLQFKINPVQLFDAK